MRISELGNSINHYENDIIVLKDRITEFENLRNEKLLKTKSLKQKIENMKKNSVRCDICKSEILRAAYSKHLKSRNDLENLSQKNICS